MRYLSLSIALLAALFGLQPHVKAQEFEEPYEEEFFALSLFDLSEHLLTNCLPGTPFKDECIKFLKVAPAFVRALADLQGIPAEDFTDYEDDIYAEMEEALKFLSEDEEFEPGEPEETALAVIDFYEMRAWGDTQCPNSKKATDPAKCCIVLTNLKKVTDSLLNSNGVSAEDLAFFEEEEGPFADWIKERLNSFNQCGKKEKELGSKPDRKNNDKKDKKKGDDKNSRDRNGDGKKDKISDGKKDRDSHGKPGKVTKPGKDRNGKPAKDRNGDGKPDKPKKKPGGKKSKNF